MLLHKSDTLIGAGKGHFAIEHNRVIEGVCGAEAMPSISLLYFNRYDFL